MLCTIKKQQVKVKNPTQTVVITCWGTEHTRHVPRSPSYPGSPSDIFLWVCILLFSWAYVFLLIKLFNTAIETWIRVLVIEIQMPSKKGNTLNSEEKPTVTKCFKRYENERAGNRSKGFLIRDNTRKKPNNQPPNKQKQTQGARNESWTEHNGGCAGW